MKILDDVEEAESVEVEGEALADNREADGSESDGDEETIVVQIGDDDPEDDDDEYFEEEGEKKRAPHWLREVRAEGRKKDARIKELERELGQRAPKQVEEEEELPAEPTLEQHDYDADAFKAALLEWADKKRKVDARKEEKAKAQREAEEAWQAKLSGYAEKKRALKVPDFDGAESYVRDTFDQTQQGIVIEVADDPALLTYALGKNKKRAAELAAIKQPVQFIKALTLMEAQIKMTSRKGPPPPERRLEGRTGGAVADNTLDKLREEAARTGDMSKVLAYKRKMRSS